VQLHISGAMGLLTTKLRFIAERVSKKIKSVNIWQSYKQERGCLVPFARLVSTLLNDEECARDNHVLACNSAKYSPIKKITDRLSKKTFPSLVVNNPPHLKYVPTLPLAIYRQWLVLVTLMFHKVV